MGSVVQWGFLCVWLNRDLRLGDFNPILTLYHIACFKCLDQLQFSWNAPALPENLSVHYTNPCPIVIEKLKQPAAQQNQGAGDGADLRSSVEFSVVSEEKLNLAVQLARRDVKRKHLQEQVKQHVKMNKCPVGFHWGKESENVSGLRASKSHLKYEHQLSNPPKMERNSTGAKVLLCDPSHVKSEPALSDSPPTRDPGPGPKKEEDKCAIEIRRLQKELQTYIQKIELLATKERSEICLDPEEERRVHIRRQEQAVRSARMLYVLQIPPPPRAHSDWEVCGNGFHVSGQAAKEPVFEDWVELL
uniref:Uncharacterized protein n=1 Tax=Pseudonaja textilis TaxID=8673 RepID=A0A670YSF8_PSETE